MKRLIANMNKIIYVTFDVENVDVADFVSDLDYTMYDNASQYNCDYNGSWYDDNSITLELQTNSDFTEKDMEDLKRAVDHHLDYLIDFDAYDSNIVYYNAKMVVK